MNEFITNTSTEKTDEQIQLDYETILQMFPNAKFTIGIPLEELDNVVSNNKTIYIKSVHNCYCYDDRPKRKIDRFIIKSSKNVKITNKMVLCELIKQDFVLDCHHHFVEGFYKCRDSGKKPHYEIWRGS